MVHLDVYVLIHNEVPAKMLHKCLISVNILDLSSLMSAFSKRVLLALDNSILLRNSSSSSRPEMSACLTFC